MSHHLILTPRDPIVVRDGRPFGNASGHRMKSLDWPYPSVLAGSLRTLLGKASGGFSLEVVEKLKQISIAGPLPCTEKELYFPAPKDGVIYEKEGKRGLMSLRPAQQAKGCDLPEGLTPLMVTEDVKPTDSPAFWSARMMTTWLLDHKPAIPPTPEEATPGNGYLNAPEQAERTHAQIDFKSGAAGDGMLFTTVGLDIAEDVRLAARVGANGEWAIHLDELNGLYPFGGERRLVHWAFDNSTTNMWDCPPDLKSRLGDSPTLIRLILATPAIFKHGWHPDWLNENLLGSPPGHPDLELKLVSACIDRWKPISGWSLEHGRWGPKAVRRMVPAGSAYFFEVNRGNSATLAETGWLRSVCDKAQDRNDGFGLALWGIWNKLEESN